MTIVFIAIDILLISGAGSLYVWRKAKKREKRATRLVYKFRGDEQKLTESIQREYGKENIPVYNREKVRREDETAERIFNTDDLDEKPGQDNLLKEMREKREENTTNYVNL